MDHVFPADEELIYPEEIKLEYKSINDLSDLIEEMKFLEDTFLSAEVKLGTITARWQTCFEDDILHNFNLVGDWLQSIKSCLDELTQKFSTNLEEEYFHDPLKIQPIGETVIEEEDQDNHSKQDKIKRLRRTRPSRNVTSHETDSDQEPSSPRSISPLHEPDSNWTPAQEDTPNPRSRPSKKRPTKVPKISKIPKVSKTSPQTNPTSIPPTRKKYRTKGSPPLPAKLECHICHKIVSRGVLTSHIKRVHEPHLLKFPCPTCSSRFPTQYLLTVHTQIHSAIKPFTCTVCGWSFHRAHNLAAHMKKHSEERPLKCDQCDATFKYVQSFKMHVDAKHSSGKKNQCAECGKLFATTTKMKQHSEQVHQSLRRFECSRCDKVFKRGQHLRYHEKTHDNPNTKNRGLNKEKP